jgi:DHA2 family multidrug resistance protein
MEAGLYQMPRMLGVLLMTPIAGRLSNYVDSRILIAFGIALMMIGYLDMAGFTLEVGWPQMLPSFLMTGAGMSFMFGPMSAVVMRTVPLDLLTAAASLYTLGRRIGDNMGYALVASLIEQRTAVHRVRLVDHVTPFDRGTHQFLDGLAGRLSMGSGLPPGVAEDSALKLLDGTIMRQATMLAYNDVFWLMGMIFVLAVPFLFLLSGSRHRPAARRAS